MKYYNIMLSLKKQDMKIYTTQCKPSKIKNRDEERYTMIQKKKKKRTRRTYSKMLTVVISRK